MQDGKNTLSEFTTGLLHFYKETPKLRTWRRRWKGTTQKSEIVGPKKQGLRDMTLHAATNKLDYKIEVC